MLIDAATDRFCRTTRKRKRGVIDVDAEDEID